MPAPAGRTSPTRRRTGRVLAVWLAVVAAVLLFAHVTAIGPVVLTLSGTHGVHLGDLLFLLLAGAAAATLTRRTARG